MQKFTESSSHKPYLEYQWHVQDENCNVQNRFTILISLMVASVDKDLLTMICTEELEVEVNDLTDEIFLSASSSKNLA
jgi:hypothetical protein